MKVSSGVSEKSESGKVGIGEVLLEMGADVVAMSAESSRSYDLRYGEISVFST